MWRRAAAVVSSRGIIQRKSVVLQKFVPYSFRWCVITQTARFVLSSVGGTSSHWTRSSSVKLQTDFGAATGTLLETWRRFSPGDVGDAVNLEGHCMFHGYIYTFCELVDFPLKTTTKR